MLHLHSYRFTHVSMNISNILDLPLFFMLILCTLKTSVTVSLLFSPISMDSLCSYPVLTLTLMEFI